MVVILGALWYVRAERLVANGLGFPLDDSWIHLQFARHVAEDGELAFNRHEPSAGSTAPLWTLLLSLPLVAGVDPIVSAKCLGTLLSVVAACLCWRLTRDLTGSDAAAWVSGLAVALSPRVTWASVSGMEVPLYLALCVGAIAMYVRDPDRLAPGWGLLSGLAGMARPETFLLFGVLGGHRLVTAVRGSNVRNAVRPLASAAIPFMFVVFLYGGLNVHSDGRPWPATLAAKSGGHGLADALANFDLPGIGRAAVVIPLNALNTYVRFFFDQSALLSLLVLPGALALGGALGPSHPRGVVVLVPMLLAPAVFGAMAPALSVPLQEGRYVAHALALTFVTAAAGFEVLRRMTRPAWPVLLVACVALARLASQDVAFASRHASMVDNITRMHLALGGWLRDHSRPDAVVAVNDIGGIAWASGRRVIDLEGLVTPEVLPFKRPGGRLRYLEQTRPDFLVIFPEWYPDLVARSDLFREVHRVTVPRKSAAHDTMIVYTTPWTRAPALN
jgi:hypothetical protein